MSGRTGVSGLLRASVTCLLAAALAAGGVAQATTAPGQAVPSIGIACPLEGKSYVGALTVSGGVGGNAGEAYTLVIEAFGTTHYFQLEPRLERRPGRGAAPARAGVAFEDPCLPVAAGPQVLKATLWSRSSAAPLVSKEVRFTVEAAPADEAKVDEARRWIWGVARSPETALEDYSLALSKARRDPRAQPEVAKAADAVANAGRVNLGQRITGYCILARHYRERLDFALERDTLLFAARIYETERARAAVHPVTGPLGHPYTPGSFQYAPWHFEFLSNLYLRLGDLASGLEWLEAEARWYEDQAKLAGLSPSDVEKCRDYAASRYWRMGWAHFLLKKDDEAFRKAIERSNAARRGG
jgi:hypothetical protein